MRAADAIRLELRRQLGPVPRADSQGAHHDLRARRPAGDGTGIHRDGRPVFGFDFTALELYDIPGVISLPTRAAEPFSRPVEVPVRPHLGVMGVAPNTSERLSSIPPGVFGGNVDNWRFGPGATIHYPVFTEGAGFYVGDPHFAQGDGEICGTAIEASLDVRLRLSLAPRSR
jgi:acetamidase/formamidase